jgi:hypothetical protein
MHLLGVLPMAESADGYVVLTPHGVLGTDLRCPSAAVSTLDDVLPASALQMLRQARAHQQSCFLLIDETCPPALQSVRWETLRLDGEPLSESALVVRQATGEFGDTTAYYGSSACINLFPRTEFDFCRRLGDLVERELLHFQPVRAAPSSTPPYELFVLAHGNVNGLQDKDGQAFALDLHGGVPTRVWLLACNLGQAIDDVVRQLLTQGVDTVLAPLGEIDTEATAQLVESWLNARASNVALEQWLAEARHSPTLSPAARALVMWGRTTCDASPAADFNGRTWAALVSGFTAVLDESWIEFQHGMAALESRAVWPATRDWMVPHLLHLAETFDHKAMLRLREGDIKRAAVSPTSYLALADSAYRLGLYQDCARELGRMAHEPLAPDQQGALLACGVNVLIDMNLPLSAERLVDRHEDLSSQIDFAGVMVDAKRLDWRARIHLRSARFSAAQQAFARKATLVQSAQPKNDNGRELAWMLYAGCWQSLVDPTDLEGVHACAAVARAYLMQADWQHAGRGKDNAPYLLRALALHAWLHGAADDCSHWVAIAHARLAEVDPGPWAFALSYLCLAGHADADSADGAIEALVGARYLFDAAVFSALLGKREAAQRHLSRYQQRRAGVIAELAAIDAGPIDAELSQRLALESVIVQGDRTELARHGIFPM